MTVRCDDLILARMDAQLIVQVIVNLIDNALKYTEQGAEICVSAEKQGGDAVIRVTDNGNGIADDMKPHIFEMFYTGKNTVADSRKMEASVWTDPKVKQILENDYVLITLMVDDKTKLPQPITIEEHGKTRKLKTIGDKWSYLQRSKFGANAQPFYILLNAEGKPLGPSYAFNESVPDYIKFLENGLKVFKEQEKNK